METETINVMVRFTYPFTYRGRLSAWLTCSLRLAVSCAYLLATPADGTLPETLMGALNGKLFVRQDTRHIMDPRTSPKGALNDG